MQPVVNSQIYFVNFFLRKSVDLNCVCELSELDAQILHEANLKIQAHLNEKSNILNVTHQNATPSDALTHDNYTIFMDGVHSNRKVVQM